MSAEVLVLLVIFTGLFLLNVPVAVCIGLATLGTAAALGDIPSAYVVAQRMSAGIASFPLLAIPFFVLAGIIMSEGGLAQPLIRLASALVGRFPGGLAYVNTLTCMLFGAVSGSAAAAVSSVGGLMVQEMEKEGYPREFACALTATSATTGLLIPPSNIMIVYAVVSGNVSIAALFIAGILPGIAVGLALMAASAFLLAGPIGRRALAAAATATSAAPRPQTQHIGPAFLGALPSLLLIALVLGGILGGLFSATEASAIAVAYTLALALVAYRSLRIRDLPPLLLKAAKTTAIVMLLVGTSQAMSWVLAYERIPQMVGESLLGLSSNPIIILLLINILLLVVGTFMDMTPAVLIFTPIFLPIVTRLGVDPVHFGIILIANLCIGLCTPPVGTCLFLSCGVGRTTIARVVPAAIPYFVAMAVTLALITYWPTLSLILPRLLNLLP